jgi:hypothetical protein
MGINMYFASLFMSLNGKKPDTILGNFWPFIICDNKELSSNLLSQYFKYLG